MKQVSLLIIIIVCLLGCGSSEQHSLDKSIPRLQSSIDQIASLRTKWWDDDHIETVYYDHQGRVLEKFSFGLSSSKELHFYEGNLQKKSIYYSHSDSSEPGYVSVDTVVREFDPNGRLVLESHQRGVLSENLNGSGRDSFKRHLSYAANGDTIVKLENQSGEDRVPLANINLWERDKNNRVERHYRLYVMDSHKPGQADTIDHYSQKFAYDAEGRLILAWFENMYLGQFYLVPGADTVWYHYNSKNQLSEEQHLYTTDFRNKREIDTIRLSEQDRESVRYYRNSFLSNAYWRGNKNYVIRYRYENFDPSRHAKLIIP
jgi:hypothetical protein